MEQNNELENFLELMDSKIDLIKTNLDRCDKLLDDTIDSLKKFQSGLMPDSELEAANKELDYDHDQQMKKEEDLTNEETL